MVTTQAGHLIIGTVMSIIYHQTVTRTVAGVTSLYVVLDISLYSLKEEIIKHSLLVTYKPAVVYQSRLLNERVDLQNGFI